MVGPAGLGVAIAALRKTAVNGERIGTWPGSKIPSWIPHIPYVYNNDTRNHGGVVPAGGMEIDGFNIPAGVWVSQFNDFDDQIIVYGDSAGQSPAFPGVIFRGCRWRMNSTAPGFINVYQNSHTKIWVTYTDAGGVGAANSQKCEVAFSTQDYTTNTYFYRNYISYVFTGIQPGNSGPQCIENYIEKLTFYYGLAGTPDGNGPAHLNGISYNGAQSNGLVLRNKILVQSPDDAGRVVDQTDCIAFFQDGGAFPGTGTNLDGSVGYLVKDNFIGGAGYCIYAGMNAGKPANSVRNMVLIGNQITTEWWPNGGSYGPLGAEPVWNTYGNVKRNNTFAESGKTW
jgi:hypothetical protein